jgi:hypothetical protein
MSAIHSEKPTGQISIQLLILDQEGPLTKTLQQEMEAFQWPREVTLNVHYCLEEEFLAKWVPLIESGTPSIVLAPGTKAPELLFKAYRYLAQPFVVNTISNDFKWLTTFYDEKHAPLLPNLLRLDACALQWHLIDSQHYYQMEDQGSRLLRLGELKQNPLLSEAMLRDANAVLLDVDAMKKSEFPAKESHHQSGLSSEEACQVIRYAGFSNKASSILIGGYPNTETMDTQSTNVLAQLIYYACDGIKNRKEELSGDQADVTRFHIEADDEEHPFIFVKGNQTGRWWVSVNDLELPETLSDHRYYPCSQADYEMAVQGEPSETLIKAKFWLEHLSQHKSE